MDRRQILGMLALGAASGTTGAGALLRSVDAQARAPGSAYPVSEESEPVSHIMVAPRGFNDRHTRLGDFDVESRQGFTKSFGAMQRREIRASANQALDRVLEREGIDPTAEMDMATLLRLVDDEPAINISAQTWLANQRLTWSNLQGFYHANADQYLSAMERADRRGPGSLELAPDLELPEHVSHQIHIQPGGYVGDPFAGHMYHYATNSFWAAGRGRNDQDQIHRAAVDKLPVPADGKVLRILDYGCGIGQFALALKERFPEAEVWGLDIGAPMIRYGHMRASHMNLGVNFVQRLAEDNGFPDGYFDLVTSYISHHEMPADVSRRVIEEAQRVTRPGGVYYPVDFKSAGTRMLPRVLAQVWWDHRWNNERWSLEYHTMNFDEEIRARGFHQQANAIPVVRGFGTRHFIRS